MRKVGDSSGISPVVVAAHELKSPLVLIRQLALGALDETAPRETLQDNVAQVSIIAERSLQLVNDLTRTQRLFTETTPLEPVSAWQICESVVEEMQPLYALYGKKITIRNERSKPLVVTHSTLLKQIVYHFADNALQHSDQKDDVEISLAVRRRSRLLRIGVRDYGPGISRREWVEAKEAVRSHFSTRPLSSGIGLFIAEKFSDAIAGKTGIVRHRDGVTFYVDVPLSEQLCLL